MLNVRTYVFHQSRMEIRRVLSNLDALSKMMSNSWRVNTDRHDRSCIREQRVSKLSGKREEKL